MSDKDKRQYLVVLKSKEAELARGLRSREEIEVQSLPDVMDAIQHAVERDLAVSSLDRDFRVLREIRFALARLNDGTYGTCLRCEEDISPRRLAALPWARLCVRCQEAVDREQPYDETSEASAA